MLLNIFIYYDRIIQIDQWRVFTVPKVIKTENLTKYYGRSRGIKNLNLNINEGDFFGFIGPNGAGKSTTIRTLLGLIFPTSGGATIFGKDIIKNHTEILNKIGYMASEAIFYNNMKVKDVIELSAKLYKTNCTDEAKTLCDRLDLDTKKRIEELSLGNRKKVSIVCALQHKPTLYILDEPTSGLDPLMQKEFFNILRERNTEGATVFLSSHVLSEIQRNCQKAAIIKEGELVTCDSVEKLTCTGTHRITIHNTVSLPAEIEIKSPTIMGNSISFLYNGNIKQFLSKIEPIPFDDISIAEPDLEEIFMHYYKKDGETK
ncbi:MAG: ABC transporter [Clostridiales bacterium]|nr:MAG: ABC transporter [Clostridiales bacterium]